MLRRYSKPEGRAFDVAAKNRGEIAQCGAVEGKFKGCEIAVLMASSHSIRR